MPFGVRTTIVTFQRVMDGFFRNELGKYLAAYIADLRQYGVLHREMLAF